MSTIIWQIYLVKKKKKCYNDLVKEEEECHLDFHYPFFCLYFIQASEKKIKGLNKRKRLNIIWKWNQYYV